MRAIQYHRFGGYDVLGSATAPEPATPDGWAIVRVALAGVSPLDNTARLGKLPAGVIKPFPVVPGSSGVGVLVEPGTSGLAVGARVAMGGGGYGLSVDGVWAELLAVNPRATSCPSRTPSNDTAAATLTTGAGHLTALFALTEAAGFRPGQAVLAPGVGGAVGQGGVEIARVLGASHAITTATSGAKAAKGREAGFEVIDLTQESLRDGVARITEGKGVDVVLDGVGGALTGEALGALAVGGSLISIGYSAGMTGTINVTDLIWRNAHIHGFRFALFTDEQVAAANVRLLDLLARKEISPITDSVFPLAEAADAQRHLIEGGPFGRVLLAV
ncbi:zinc-binding alcohol dehydrogenase family protein [Kutzneria sp. 744]|uniref:quinone oxidoreductase family protein n=1 Tax=Kutzneria sp. (strain 744) TaxID=345341 RepID=UPI0003EEAA48|nr:zinc-binding alcohol dehydrogenase family protein [Kutzneria sp. 744]EWM10842.1 quinone oxidoreductase [Kutzneria sp. 744]